MLHKVGRLFLAAIAIFLGGCANHFGVSGVDYKLGSAPQGEGLVAFSTRWVFACNNTLARPVNPYLHFARGDSQFAVMLYNMVLPYHFENPPGYFYVFSKPAGDYVAKDLEVLLSRRQYQQPIAPQQASFRVREGKITYAGEITVKMTDCELSSETKMGKVTLSVANQWESRDRALFAERLPNVDSNAVVMDLLKLQ